MWLLSITCPGDVQIQRIAVGSEWVQVTLGRGPECDVVIDHAWLSRAHARLNLSPSGEVWLEDLKSKHGTFVNGKRVLGFLRLRPGDGIGLAEVMLAVEHVPEAALLAASGIPMLRPNPYRSSDASRPTAHRDTPPYSSRPNTLGAQTHSPRPPPAASEHHDSAAWETASGESQKTLAARRPARAAPLMLVRKKARGRARSAELLPEHDAPQSHDEAPMKTTGELVRSRDAHHTGELPRRTGAQAPPSVPNHVVELLASIVSSDDGDEAVYAAPAPAAAPRAPVIPGARVPVTSDD